MRTKKSLLNLLSDLIPQLILVVLSFIRIKLFLSNLGSETLGAYQLFTQILAYLALAELGLTSAVMYMLYKPISEKDHNKISSIIAGAKKTFNLILIFMLIVGLGISPWVKNLISSTTLTNSFIITAFVLTLIANVLTYLSTSYTIMFDANQDKYKYNFYIQIINIVKQIAQIVLIVMFKNIFLILGVEILAVIIRNLVVKFLFKKNYTYIDMKAKKDYSFWKKTKDLIPHKVGSLIANNIDIIIASKFINLTAVVIYTSYSYITSTIAKIVGNISGATLSSIGNLLVEDKERSYPVFLEYNSMLFYISTVICVPLAIVITPFIKLWYGSQYIVNNFTMYLFVFILFYGIIRIVLNTFASAAGLFKETLISPILEVIINLTVSLALVGKYGILGLLLGTSLSYIISEFLIKPFVLNKHIFKSNVILYYKDCFIFILIVGIEFVLLKKASDLFVIGNLLTWFLLSISMFIVNFLLTTGFYKIIKRFNFINRLKKVRSA